MAAVVALVDDLMFVSRIREAAKGHGLEVRAVRGVPALLEACGADARLVVVDLDSARLPVAEALAALAAAPVAAPVVGFFSHVHAERARQARAAGISEALPRSVFVERLPALLADAALDPPGPGP
jgi:DNA-binding NarL/FixJ family response regulator